MRNDVHDHQLTVFGRYFPLLHPFFFGVAPILSLYLDNIDRFSVSGIVGPCALVVTIVGCLYCAGWVLTRHLQLVALVLSYLLIVGFLYGSVQSALGSMAVPSGLVRSRVLIPLCGILLILISWISWKYRERLVPVNRAFLAVSLSLVMILMFQIVMILLEETPYDR
jgi:hypothetical protein